LIDLFSQCSSSSAFTQLRTNEQLGYVVWSGTSRENGVHGFRVIIQSDLKDPVVLDQRIEAWIASFEKEFRNMPEEEFVKYREGLIVQKLDKDKSLKEETTRWRTEIEFPHTQKFDRAKREAEAIEKLSKDDILNFYKKYIAQGGSRAKLSVQIFGKDHVVPERTSSDPSVVVITDISAFKKAMPLYPVFNDLSQYIPEN